MIPAIKCFRMLCVHNTLPSDHFLIKSRISKWNDLMPFDRESRFVFIFHSSCSSPGRANENEVSLPNALQSVGGNSIGPL